MNIDASYWFSKALDLGSSYTNTANEGDSRQGRSQSEYETHRDMKGLSSFDQTHAFLLRANYAIPAIVHRRRLSEFAGGWNLSAVVLIKTGIPFNVAAGSDGPGFGNVDGNGSDRPILLDPSILGRTIADPDTSKQMLPRKAFTYITPDQVAAMNAGKKLRLGFLPNIRHLNQTMQHWDSDFFIAKKRRERRTRQRCRGR